MIGALGMRGWLTRSAPDLEAWHVIVPEELNADALDHGNWSTYLDAESRIFKDVAQRLHEEVEVEDRVAFNRYYEGSVVSPARFGKDWNRSFVLEPASDPTGVVVLLHGLSDSPYSLRHIAQFYRSHGFVALGLRLPGHGTVPGGLTHIQWTEWLAAVRLTLREAGRRSSGRPVHIVGYSNGGALAVKYALDALEDRTLPRAQRIVLISPMIGVTAHARFAGIAGWPAILPAFAKSAWLENLPEFNPFKYNSFPVNAARQSYLLTESLREQLVRLREAGRLDELPPILTFQSMVDATVRTDAVAAVLYANLPANGSELVLFDINRNVDLTRLLRPGAMLAPSRMLSAPPRAYRVAVVSNATPQSRDVVARVLQAGDSVERVETLDLAYPPEVFSLSHVALPFPVSDGLYGLAPDMQDDFGIRLGTLGVRGERGVLLAGLDSVTVRINSNPFFSYLVGRIEAGISEGNEE